MSMVKKNNISETDASLWATLTKDCQPLTTKVIPPTQNKLPNKIVPNYIFSPVIDLHGTTVHDAFKKVDQQLHQAHQIGWKRITIITGKSGPISSEFEEWIKHRSEIQKSKSKDGGSWEIWLKK